MIADFHRARALFDPVAARDVLALAARAANATVLEINLHDFGAGSGFTGVVLLAESHISIHTWPEFGYAAIDIFMCGDADPRISLKVLEDYFCPEKSKVQLIGRGLALNLDGALPERTMPERTMREKTMPERMMPEKTMPDETLAEAC